MKAARLVMVSIIVLSVSNDIMAWWLSMNAKHDPLPPYSTLDPHTFLYTRERNRLKGLPVYRDNEIIGLSISPYGQNANRGRNRKNKVVPLGDLPDRWDMVALLFGPVPQGKVLPPTLVEARAALFPTIPAGTPITDRNFIDRNEQIGFFSIASTYRKRGLRFEFDGQIFQDVGISVEGGLTDLCHTVTHIKNLTCGVEPNCPSGITFNNDFNATNINDFLMDRLENIAKEIGLNLSNYHQFSFEDLRVSMYWRHAYELNKGLVGKDYCWSRVFLIPFVLVGGSLATSRAESPSRAFALTFGNNDHHSVGLTAGLNLDFVETVEIGGEAGITHFFAKDFSHYRVPNSKSQQGIFPFTTDVRVHPGHNWHFALKLSAYHFLRCLSFYFQYVIVQHQDDKICLKCPDEAFVPKVLEKVSTWKVQVANIGFNYDISPEITLGFLWQAPLARRNAFRSTTVMFSFNLQY